jgi:hypothetical protein
MNKNNQLIRTTGLRIVGSLLAAGTLVLAQEPPAPPPSDTPQQNSAPSGRWRRLGDPPPAAPADAAPAPAYPTEPNAGLNQAPPANRPADAPNEPSNYILPSQLTVKTGTFVTVRVNQPLSSDHNQVGDAFTATLARPLVVDGVVVAERGQTIGGRVAEAQKAGRVEGLSRLGIQLTDLTLVDGQQLPIRSQLISRTGPSSSGRDAGAIMGTTAAGAAVGAGVNGGVGAGVGAAAGLVVGTVGVLLTRGHPTVITPESVLTFRVEAPVTFSTDRAPQAFRLVRPGEYDRPSDLQARMTPPNGPPPAPYYGGYYAPYYGYYGPGWYPYSYWGPSLGFYWGPRFYGGFGYGGFYRGGFYGGGFRHR